MRGGRARLGRGVAAFHLRPCRMPVLGVLWKPLTLVPLATPRAGAAAHLPRARALWVWQIHAPGHAAAVPAPGTVPARHAAAGRPRARGIGDKRRRRPHPPRWASWVSGPRGGAGGLAGHASGPWPQGKITRSPLDGAGSATRLEHAARTPHDGKPAGLLEAGCTDFLRVGSLKKMDCRLLPYSLHARRVQLGGDRRRGATLRLVGRAGRCSGARGELARPGPCCGIEALPLGLPHLFPL